MKKLIKYLIYTLLSVTLFFVLIFTLFNKLSPLDKAIYSKPTAKIIYDKNGNIIRMLLSEDGFWRFRVKYKNIPKFLINSVITFEDKYFFYHYGINPISIFRAIKHNLNSGRKIGASTITMQVARMMERRERNYLSKFIEILRAIQLEISLTKEEILEIYFNIAPYGGNIEGVRAAAYFYFNKPLSSLSYSQMAILTTIPKNPNLNRPDRQKNLEQKRDRVLKELKDEKIITKSAYSRALREKIDSQRYKAVYKVQHFTNLEYFQKQDICDIYTTIDLDLQLFIEEFLKNEIKKYPKINNSSAIVIDNEKNSIIAYIGSNDFFDNINGGENNGVEMIRSPGSTLKPFIYALSFDEGLITPKKKLLDIPLNYYGYVPENYDKLYRGLISAKEALKLSLNSVVIDLNNNLKNNSLFELLTKAKINSIDKDRDYYGLSIALGGVGISLKDLVFLYSSFANKGELKEITFLKNQKSKTLTKLFSKKSAFVVSEILADGYRKELSNFWDSKKGAKKIAFKTGTSADNKDLFTIGFTKNYTVGVWMGNFDSTVTDKKLSGIDTASLAMFSIFEYISKKDELTWISKPKNLRETKQCLDYVALPNCKRVEEDFIIAKESKCLLLDPLKIKYLLYRRVIKDIKELQQNSCYYNISQKKPKILSPLHNNTLYSTSQIPQKYQKVKVECFSYKDDQTVYVKINDKDIFTQNANNSLFVNLDIGVNIVECMDSKGYIDKVFVELK